MEELPQLVQSFIQLRMGHCYRNYMRSFAQNDFNMFQILEFIRKHGRVHPNEMSENLSIATSQMAVLLNHLESEGMINRVRDEKDHRKTIIEITSKGVSHNKMLIDKYHDFLSEVFSSMGDEDASLFVELFSKFIAASFRVFEERNTCRDKTINSGCK